MKAYNLIPVLKKNNWIQKIGTILICIFSIVNPSELYSQKRNPFIQDSLDNYIINSMKLWEIPGVAVSIIKNDSVIYCKGFGVNDVKEKKAVDTKTNFRIWSMGKSFTAFSLALLENRKKIELDKPVKNYLHSFKMANKLFEDEINSIDLLSHRIGIETFQGDFLWSESNLSDKELLNKWSNIKPTYPFRSGFQYSNYGYLIAGELISKLSNKNWKNFINDELFVPLGMENSFFDSNQTTNTNLSIGHTKVNGKIERLDYSNNSKSHAFGGVFSNVEDLSKWIKLFLNKGVHNNKQIFDYQIIKRVTKSQNIIGKGHLPDGTSPNMNYALGWEVRDYNNREVITHGGAYSGYLSMMGYVPKENLGFVILTNSDSNELVESLKWQIIDAFTGRKFNNYSIIIDNYNKERDKKKEENIEKKEIERGSNNLDTELLKNIIGTYENDVYGKITIGYSESNGLNMLFENHPNLSAKLDYLGNQKFKCKYSLPLFGEVTLSFNIIENRKISFDLYVDPFVEFTHYRFTKKIKL